VLVDVDGVVFRFGEGIGGRVLNELALMPMNYSVNSWG